MTDPGPQGNYPDPPPGYSQPDYAPQGYAQPGYQGTPQVDYQQFISKKTAAGVCGILIGSLGIHKFILGQNTAGIIMLVVSVCTCGVGGFVMHIIGLIEDIMYLTKSDAEFYQLYAVEKKAWF